jgi:hypothetical protein
VVHVGKRALRKILRVVYCYTTKFFIRKSYDNDTDSLKYFNVISTSCSFL